MENSNPAPKARPSIAATSGFSATVKHKTHGFDLLEVVPVIP
jgi:hypothetical protein